MIESTNRYVTLDDIKKLSRSEFLKEIAKDTNFGHVWCPDHFGLNIDCTDVYEKKGCIECWSNAIKDIKMKGENDILTKSNLTSNILDVIKNHQWNYDGEPASISVENEQIVIHNSDNKIVWFCDLDTVNFTYYTSESCNKIIFCDENNIDFELADEQ